MDRATFRRAASEDGIWGVAAATGVAAFLLAALAVSLDLTAVSSARTQAQLALDAALRSAAHEIVPASIASSSPEMQSPDAEHAVQSTLDSAIQPPLQFRITQGPTVLRGMPPAISAAISVRVPLPALVGTITLPVRGEAALGWLPR